MNEELRIIADNEPVRSTLADMEVGESVAFSGKRLRTVAVTCSDIGFELRRKYRRHIDRERHLVIATRMA